MRNAYDRSGSDSDLARGSSRRPLPGVERSSGPQKRTSRPEGRVSDRERTVSDGLLQGQVQPGTALGSRFEGGNHWPKRMTPEARRAAHDGTEFATKDSAMLNLDTVTMPACAKRWNFIRARVARH